MIKQLFLSLPALLLLIFLAFLSIQLRSGNPAARKTDTSVRQAEGDLPNQEANRIANAKKSVSLETVDSVTRDKYKELLQTYQKHLDEWGRQQHLRSEFQEQRKSLESELDNATNVQVASPVFEPREWVSVDGKFKTKATLIESDFTTAKLKKEDGKTIEVTKEKLSDADRQAIERAFAALEVSRKKTTEKAELVSSLQKKIAECENNINTLQLDKPTEPKIEDAISLVNAEKLSRLKNDAISDEPAPNFVDPSTIEVIETKLTERPNAKGEPMDVIETKFKNNGTERVKIIDVEYIIKDPSGRTVLRQPYTLFAERKESNGLEPGGVRQTAEDGFYLPKNLGAKSASVIVTKVYSFKRIPASSRNANDGNETPDYVPPGFHYISSRMDPLTPGDLMHVYWSDKSPLDKNELVAFCKAFREKDAGRRFSYLVVFKSKETAVYPSQPYTAFYGDDTAVYGQIRFYYEYNKVNGYSNLTFVGELPPAGMANSTVIP